MKMPPDVIIVQPLNLSIFVSPMTSSDDIPAHSVKKYYIITFEVIIINTNY